MAAITSNVLTVPDFERPILILNKDPSRPPSSQSLHRSMSEESLNKITIPITREAPYFINHMPPSPAKTPTNRSQENITIHQSATMSLPAEQILPLGDVNISITNLHQTVVASKEDYSPLASKSEVDDYIQQTADILSETVKEFQELRKLEISEKSNVEQLIAANLRLLRTLKDRHAALDKVEQEVRDSRSSGPYTSIGRSIYFDTPGFTPPQGSRITFKDSTRRNSDEMDGMSTTSIDWNEKKEERLVELGKLVKSANRAWSAEQNNYLEELEHLQEEKRRHKKKLKMEQRASVKMERSLSMSNEREQRRASTSRERASSADTKRRLSLGFVPKPMTRSGSSSSFIERIFRVGK